MIHKIVRKPLFSAVSLGYLFLTPWFVQLITGGWQPLWQQPLVSSFSEFISNLGKVASFNFLFFQFSDKPNIWNMETGPLYVAQLPLFILGLWFLLEGKKYFWPGFLALAFVGAAVFSPFPVFSASLIYFLPATIVSLSGLSYLADKAGKWFWFFSAFALYELIWFLHIILVHYPQRL